MGTAWREIYTFWPGFSRAGESSPDVAGTATLSRARAPLSGRTHSRAPCPSQRKENSSRGCRRLLRGRLRHRTGRLAAPVSAFQVRGSEPDSLSIGRGRRRPSPQPFRTAFAYPLGPTDPCSTAVHMEPFPTSVFRGLVGIFATTTEICTRGGSSRARARTFDAHRGDPPTRRSVDERKLPAPTAGHRLVAPAPSIFRASRFGR